MNNLDAVRASLPSADKIVLLGHDNALLTDDDKVRLAAVAAAKADRTSTPRQRPSRRARNTRSGRVNRAQVSGDATLTTL